MEHRMLGRTGLQVSAIGLGALEIGRDWGIEIAGDYGRPSEEGAIRLVQAAIAAGINFIDTAPAYQLSEERIGKALAGRRNEVYLATKVGEHWEEGRGFWYDYGPEAVARSIEQSLRRLRTDVIDLLQIHSASVEIIRQGEVLGVMQRFQQQGHVRFIGMTGDNDAALAAIADGRYDTVQVPYNITQQSAAREVFPRAESHDIGVIVMFPLGAGALSEKHEHLDAERREQIAGLKRLERPGRTLAQVALRFVLAQPAVSCAIPGTRKIEHLHANAEAAAESLTPEELESLAG